MGYPIEERLKNLEQLVRQLQGQNYTGHSSEDKVFHGVVTDISPFLDDTNTCTCQLLVQPKPPYAPAQDGELTFIGTTDHPLTGTGAGHYTIPVYCLNVPPDLYRAFFQKGDVIKFWHYSGTGAKTDQADIVKGTPVTIVEDWSFYARIDWDNDADMYRFTAIYFDPTDSGADSNWVELTQCDDGDNKFTGHCINFDVTLGTFPRSPKRATPFIAKVKRFINPHIPTDPCALDDVNSTCWQYYFSSEVVIHWGVIADVGNCGASITVNPSDENGNLLSSVSITLATFAGCTTTYKGICAEVGNIVPYILTGEAEGTLINPYKRWSAWYTCGTNTSVVPDVREVKFSRYYFVLDTLTESDCETADPSILTVDWRGMRVTGYSNSHNDDIKEITFTGPTPPSGSPGETFQQVSFKVTSSDATRTIAGNTCPQETHKNAEVTGFVKTKKVTVLDSDCQPLDIWVFDTNV